MNADEIQSKLEDKIKEITKELSKGKHIEIHLARDGIKIFSVNKKIVS